MMRALAAGGHELEVHRIVFAGGIGSSTGLGSIPPKFEAIRGAWTMSEKQLERLLVPIIAGAFRGTNPA